MLEHVDRFIQKIALVLLLAVLLGIPAAAWSYEKNQVKKYPPNAKVFNITGVARLGMWTEARVNGLNYWRDDLPRLNKIQVKKGDLVVLRLKSSDLVHGFTIPELEIDAGQVKAGKINTVQFVADKAGSFTFRCSQFCNAAHPAMFGVLEVAE